MTDHTARPGHRVDYSAPRAMWASSKARYWRIGPQPAVRCSRRSHPGSVTLESRTRG